MRSGARSDAGGPASPRSTSTTTSRSRPASSSRSARNVVLSPHLGFVNDPVFSKFGPGVVENLLRWLRGQPLVRELKAGGG
jgi:phosphoglycerate dehydrogenase-like enzyme